MSTFQAVNIMAADGLAMQRSRASAAMALTWLAWNISVSVPEVLTHWGRVTHICVGKLSIIGSDNGLSPSRRQAIIWTNTGILLIGILGTNFSEISIEIYTFSFKKMHLKMLSGKWRPCCLGLNVLMHWGLNKMVTILQMTLQIHSKQQAINSLRPSDAFMCR